MMKTFLPVITVLLLALLVIPASAQELVPNDTTKTMILHFHINGSVVTFVDAKVIYGHSPDNLDIKDTFTGKMLGPDDKVMRKFGISDARVTYSDEGHLFTDNINFSVKVPATMDLATVGVYDTKTDTLLAKADAAGVMKGFCTTHPKDPDCSRVPLWMIGAGAGILVLIAGAGAWYVLKHRKEADLGR
jgi:hypothetical protein